MQVLEQLERVATYHLWAQERALSGLEAMGENAPQEALRLFFHIETADRVWLARITKQKFDRSLLDQTASLKTCRNELEALKKEWSDYLDGLSEDALDSGVRYVNPKGERFTSTLRDILTHVFNHGTYHRAQIARIVRQAGGIPVVSDFIVFAREN